MNRATLHLIVSILSLLVFIGYLSEPGPYEIFGTLVNIWVIRAIWLMLAVSSFLRYRSAKKLKG